ncbi:MAG: penicillin-binding protein 1C [Bacteroidetes bacterium]|nr:penicillin-binding protein 1C [Bacteroidota bacterium]
MIRILSSRPPFVRFCLIWLIFPAGGLFTLFLVFNAVFPLPPLSPYSPVVIDRTGAIQHVALSADEKWRIRTDWSKTNPDLIRTIIDKEDRWFWIHPGINPFSIIRALAGNLRDGYVSSGASTITMQLARLTEPRSRTLSSKLIECFRALQLEWTYSKTGILHAYLDRLPYGGNIEGAGTASWYYFQKPVETLSPAQFITLTIIPNRPRLYRPHESNKVLLARRNEWLQKLTENGNWGELSTDDASAEPLTFTPKSFPRGIPHLSRFLVAKASGNANIQSTIDPSVQQKTEQLIYSHASRNRFTGINSMAAIVIDNQRSEVLAWVGSPDFSEEQFSGQVDGILAIRSPGSSLKPFVYARAIDAGLVTPLMMINDLPANFNGYQPVNYSGEFAGRITVTEALTRSLNIPAVSLASQLTVRQCIEWLTSMDMGSLQNQQDGLGLSFVLGGCGVTLFELTQAYTVFANRGLFRKVRMEQGQSDTSSVRVMSESAAWMISSILSSHTDESVRAAGSDPSKRLTFSWKTGTSYGRRDGWAIGYNDSYTIGVWAGNFDGTGVYHLSGTDICVPVLADLMAAIQPEPGLWPPARPSETGIRMVCQVTGKPAGPECKDQVMDVYIPGMTLTGPCDHQKKVMINPSGTTSYCPNCQPEAGYRIDWYDNVSADLAAFYRSVHHPFRESPPHNPSCTRWISDEPLTILSPLHQFTYYVDRDDPISLELSANVPVDSDYLIWVINQSETIRVRRGESAWFKPTDTYYSVTATDSKGRTGSVRFEVRYP